MTAKRSASASIPPQRARGRKREPRHTTDQVAKALELCGGNCTRAAKKLGLTPRALRLRLAKEPKLAAIRAEAGEQLLDLAEDGLVTLIRARNPHAILGLLKLKGQARGYVASHAVDAKVESKGATLVVSFDASKDPGGARATGAALRKMRRQHPGAAVGMTWLIPNKRPLDEAPEDAEPTAEPADDTRPEECADDAATPRATDLEDEDEDQD
jgi:hypothetical protein